MVSGTVLLGARFNHELHLNNEEFQRRAQEMGHVPARGERVPSGKHGVVVSGEECPWPFVG